MHDAYTTHRLITLQITMASLMLTVMLTCAAACLAIHTGSAAISAFVVSLFSVRFL
jgi:hypothetical protein